MQTQACEHCGRYFRPKTIHQVHCSIDCKEAGLFRKSAKFSRKHSPVPLKHRGGRAETMAAAWLLEHGYEVFRNVSDKGPIDLIAFKEGRTLLIDVKYIVVEALRHSGGNREAKRVQRPTLKADQIKLGVVPLLVSPHGYCSFDPGDLERMYDELYREYEKS